MAEYDPELHTGRIIGFIHRYMHIHMAFVARCGTTWGDVVQRVNGP